MGTTTTGRGETLRWLEKARWRMAECERELRKLTDDAEERRRKKIIRRMRKNRGIVQDLQEQARRDPARELDELEADVVALRNRIMEASSALVVARDNWNELRGQWGQLADDVMRERERKGEPPGRVPRVDFEFPPPGADASEEERAAHAIIRSLDL